LRGGCRLHGGKRRIEQDTGEKKGPVGGSNVPLWLFEKGSQEIGETTRVSKRKTANIPVWRGFLGEGTTTALLGGKGTGVDLENRGG